MESIAAFDKVKSPVIALLGGIVIGGSIIWTIMDRVDGKELGIYETKQKDLSEQLADRNKVIASQDAQLKALNSKLSVVQNGSSSRAQLEESLQNLIAQLDAEIKKKKLELAMNSEIVAITENDRSAPHKSDTYLRLEQELAALNEQRDLARKKQIDNLSCSNM